MSTDATRQVISSSLDAPGLSVVTTTRNHNSTRAGSIYDMKNLAAAQPVWFHPMHTGEYLAVFSRRLRNAVLGMSASSGPILYDTATVDTTPCWAIINPATGAVRGLAEIPSEQPGIRVLTAGASRGEYLFTLNRYKTSEDDEDVYGLLQNFRVHDYQGITLLGEEKVPRDLRLGLYADRRHIWVFGDTGDKKLGVARKSWSRIGTDADANPVMNWQFRGNSNWYPESTRLAPITDMNNQAIPADGPCSLARYRDSFYLLATTRTVIEAATGGTGSTGGGTGSTTGTGSTAANPLFTIVKQLTGVLGGVLNGFLPVNLGSVGLITNLFNQATTAITGQSGNTGTTTVNLVDDLLKSLTGIGSIITDPAAILENIVRAITGIPGVSQVVTLAQSFLEKVVNAVLGVVSTVAGPGPAAILESLIRAITGIPGGGSGGGTGSTGGTGGTGSTADTGSTAYAWDAKAYVTRRVEDLWNPHGFTYRLANSTESYQGGGAYLQEQLPLTPGFGSTVTKSDLTILDETSEHVQVFTGSANQTVILPATAKVVGSITTSDGITELGLDVNPPMLSITDSTVTEGNLGPVVVRFKVTLSRATASTVTVKYTTADATATTGEDYSEIMGTLTFAPGVVAQQVITTVTGDTKPESDETFLVTLSNPVNAELAVVSGTCTIVNDDANTFIESLLANFANILKGLASGALKIGGLLVSSVATLLEQATRTVTNIVGDTGQLVLSLVDTFLRAVSGGLVDLPGEQPDPAELLADIFNQITGAGAVVNQTLTNLAQEFLAVTTGTVTGVIGAGVGIFQQLINNLLGVGGNNAPLFGTFSLTSGGGTGSSGVAYIPYTIHNQSSADIAVMSSDRQKPVYVPHGTGFVFTPYSPTPTTITDWSWTYATARAPRLRQGFPFVSTARVNNTHGNFTLLTRWSLFVPDPLPIEAAAAPSTADAGATGATGGTPSNALIDLIAQFTTVVNAITGGILAVGAGPINTVTDILNQAVALVTGKENVTPSNLPALVTDFLQQLAVGGANQDAAVSFETLLRQVTGGTGLTGGTVPTPQDFVENLVNAAENTVETLASWLQQIINAITGQK